MAKRNPLILIALGAGALLLFSRPRPPLPRGNEVWSGYMKSEGNTAAGTPGVFWTRARVLERSGRFTVWIYDEQYPGGARWAPIGHESSDSIEGALNYAEGFMKHGERFVKHKDA